MDHLVSNLFICVYVCDRTKLQKRIIAPHGELPPRDEQFILDFEQLQGQFSVCIRISWDLQRYCCHDKHYWLTVYHMILQDLEQLRTTTEAVLISFIVQCSSHAPQSEFLLFATRNLCSRGYLKWDTFLLSLVSAVSSAEATFGQVAPTTPVGLSSPLIISSSSLPNASNLHVSSSSNITMSNASNLHASNPASPLPTIHGVSSPAQSTTDQSAGTTLSPIKPSELSVSGHHGVARSSHIVKGNAIGSLRQFSCRIILAGLDFSLKPITHAEIFTHMLNWLVNWDQRSVVSEESDNKKTWKPERPLHEWRHTCLDVVWMLVDEDKCRIPFYELIRSSLQFMDNIPDDEAMFSIILEIHRRRDMVAMHMQMLDQHLHCPTFATHRFLTQSYPSLTGESLANVRYSPITYPGVLGEPLHGEVSKIVLFIGLNYRY